MAAKELTCPAPEQAGFDALRKKVEEGADINPHLSRKNQNDPDYDDGLLNDWGIHHLHLGISASPGGPVPRTGPLLFARVTETHLYAINVLAHGAWTNKHLIEVINSNWPETLAPYKLKGAVALETVVSDEQHKDLRDSGVTTMLQLSDGSVLMGPGGGLMTSGIGLRVVMQSDLHAKWARAWEKWVRDNASELLASVKNAGFDPGPNPTFKLQYYDGVAHALEVTAKVAFPLPT